MESKIKSILKKIEESNHFQIQRESVLLIYQLLLNEKSNQIFDTSFLIFLQLIYNANTHVIDTTVECIINLVKQKRVNRELVLNKFIESISSLERTNVGILVKAIIQLSIDIEYMSKIIKDTNSKGFAVFPLNTLTKQQQQQQGSANNNNNNNNSSTEIYQAFSEEIEILLSDFNVPPSLRDQRYEFLKPLLSNLLLNTNERPLETSLLHNTLIRIAHNVQSLYQPILTHLVSLLYFYNNSSSGSSSRYQKIQYVRDIIDLIRFPPTNYSFNTNLSNGRCSEFQKSILSIIYYLLNVFISSRDEKETSIRNMVLGQIKDLIQFSPTLIFWNQSMNSSSQNLNAPIIVVLSLLLPSSLVTFQNKIIEIIEISLETLSTTVTINNSNKQFILNKLKLTLSPLIRMISTTKSNQIENDHLKSLLKQIQLKIFEISSGSGDSSTAATTATTTNKSNNQDEDEDLTIGGINNIPILDIYLLDNFIPINIAWNLLNKNQNELNLEMVNNWLNLVNQNLINQKEFELSDNQDDEDEDDVEEDKSKIKSKSSNLSNINFSNEFLIYFLSPWLISSSQYKNGEDDVKIQVIKLLPNICRDSIEMISIIPLFFYSIQHEESSSVIYELLSKLTELGKNKDCFNSIVKILSILENGSSAGKKNTGIMPSYILRLYCKLWSKSNPMIFTKIEELIYSIIQVSPPSSDSNNNNNNEMNQYFENRVSVAATIKEICEIDTNQGQELIQPLSQFLCKDNNPITLSLSLESLGLLCESEILSFTSAWNVIKKNLGSQDGFENDKRSPIVLISLLEFFSMGIYDIVGESNLEQKTIDVISDIISRIWNLSNHSDEKVRSKAYQVLGKYVESCSNNELYEKLESKSSTLLSSLQSYQSVDKNLCYLLKSLLSHELIEKRQLKTAHQNLKQTKSISIFNQSSSSNGQLKIYELLNSELTKDNRSGIKSGLLGGLLWLNKDGDDESSSSGKKVESKKEILTNFKYNNQILMESISGMDNSRDLLCKLISMGSWCKFMNQCFIAFKKNETMRQSLPSGVKLSIKETNEKVYRDIESTLIKSIMENTSTIEAENSVYALIGLAKSVHSICYSQFENVISTLVNWITNYNSIFNGKNSDSIQSISYLGIGILLPYLLKDSTLLKDCINILEFASTSPDSKLDDTIKFNCFLSMGICTLKLSSFDHSNEKKRLNQILYNSFIGYFNQSSTVIPNESMTLSGLCLAIGYASDSFEQLSMTNQLFEIYGIIKSKLIGDVIVPNNLSFNFLLISFTSIIGSCFKLSLIDSNEIKLKLLPWYQDQQQQSQQSSIYNCIAYGNLIQTLLKKGYTGIDLSTIQKLLITNNQAIGSGISANQLINSVILNSILLGSPILTQSSSTLFESNLETSVIDFINSKPTSRKEFQLLLNEILNSMIQLVTSTTTDSKVIRYTSICLGSITLSISGSGNNGIDGSSSGSGNEPENFDHLPNELIVKGLFNILTDQKSSLASIESCIRIFSNIDDGSKLPLVNWGAVLKRLYSGSDGNESIKKKCIKFICNNPTLSTCSIVISEWLSVSIFKNSSPQIQKSLIKSLPSVIIHLTPTRIQSIFDELLKVIESTTTTNGNEFISLIWNICYLIYQKNTTGDELSIKVKEILSRFIILNIKLLPSPFSSSKDTNDESEQLSNENMKLLRLASKSLVYLSKEQLLQSLTLLSGIVDIDYEAKIQYLYVLVLGNSVVGNPLGKISLSNFYKIKSWCFSSNTAHQQSKVLAILPHILTLPLVKFQNQLGFSAILNDIFDSISLSSKQHIIGLELLAQFIGWQINYSNFELNSFFNLYDNTSGNGKEVHLHFTVRYLELLPYYLQILFCNNKYTTLVQNVKIGEIISKLSTILQTKSNVLFPKTKSLLFSSILILTQLKSTIESSSSTDNVQTSQQLNIFNLYKILKSSF